MQKKILFVYTNFSTFVRTDFEILSEVHKVTKYQYKPVKGILKNAVEFIKQFFFLLFNIWKFDAVFIWFADYHSFLPVLFAKILGKKSFVVVGGYDVANIPELRYGSLSSPLRRSMTVFALRFATISLAVVEDLENRIRKICPKAKTMTLYTGYHFLNKENIHFEKQREKIVLTVSITDNYQRIQIKGLDRFRELAEKLPDFKFIIIGVTKTAKQLFNPVPENLLLQQPVNQNELVSFYKSASFYAQLSRSEGLPNALCEAMLYGCIPLGTNVGGNATAIENPELLLDEWNDSHAVNIILKNHNLFDRQEFRNQILLKFDLHLRETKLKEIVN